MSIFTVHAGHAAPGKKFTGAVGYCSESYVDRQIKDSVIKWMRHYSALVADCTVDSGLSQSNIITKIKKNINGISKTTANISIHLNASKKSSKDGKTKGVECCVYDTNTADAVIAERICKRLSALGFTNRGVKKRTDLGVLKGIKNGGANILIEVFFCDDEDDFLLYSKLGADAIGKTIAEAILDRKEKEVVPAKDGYTWMGIDYSPVFDAAYYLNTNADVQKAYPSDAVKAFEHFCMFGMKEGRQGCKDFNPRIYMERYPDLKAAFGANIPAYYKHYCTNGKKEGRTAI